MLGGPRIPGSQLTTEPLPFSMSVTAPGSPQEGRQPCCQGQVGACHGATFTSGARCQAGVVPGRAGVLGCERGQRRAEQAGARGGGYPSGPPGCWGCRHGWVRLNTRPSTRVSPLGQGASTAAGCGSSAPRPLRGHQRSRSPMAHLVDLKQVTAQRHQQSRRPSPTTRGAVPIGKLQAAWARSMVVRPVAAPVGGDRMAVAVGLRQDPPFRSASLRPAGADRFWLSPPIFERNCTGFQ